MRARQPVRDCWLAVNLSGLLPGSGQCYDQQWIKGLLIMATFVVLVLHGLWSLLAADGQTTTAFWLFGIASFVYFLNVWDAFATAGRPLHPMGDKKRGRDIWYGVFLSQVLPGLGHLYLNKAITGAIFLACGVGLSLIANYQPILLPMACTVWAVAGYHTYRITPPTPGKDQSRSVKMLMVVILGGLFLRLSIGSLPMWIDNAVLQCVVPSESMVPTLQVNDRIFVDRKQYYRPDFEDIVVFEAPPAAREKIQADPGDLFVKRVVGVPGQTVEVREGHLWIDHEPISESYVTTYTGYEWGPQTVPADHYFVLGDNRNASADSHVWGFLPLKYIVGEAYKIYWPTERVQPL
ncbi:MAG: signal peptidase I [Cyanobacteria bacterium P01_D01_bin.105]